MEDVHRLILWNEIRQEEEDHSIKRPKVNIEENATSADDDDATTKDPISILADFSTISQTSETKVSCFIVCDGHGGVQAANYVNSHLFNNITSHPRFEEEPEAAILDGFARTEEEYTQLAKVEDIDGMVGTTVTIVIIMGNQLYVANLGDSEAVLCSKGKKENSFFLSFKGKEYVLTDSHIPSNPSENSRVISAGGIIVSDKKGTKRLAHPTWNPNFVNLGVTRAIGDIYFKHSDYIGDKTSGLIAVPSVKKWNLTNDDEFMVLASDGNEISTVFLIDCRLLGCCISQGGS
jgi:protein phosphatase 1L